MSYEFDDYGDLDETYPYEGDNEPADIDGDFGYDPYAGGPEMDDLDDGRYDSWQDESEY